ncbi:MAG: polysaccharide deacetylase family protein [Anaerolineae bacterium]|nr:polysaccharide deacetylase family protein [Anaerolineae bacterium]
MMRHFKPVGLVLMYHRISNALPDPRGTNVSPVRFRQHVAYLHDTCHPMHLLDLVEAAERGDIPHRAVAVTFDDGYANNLDHALPCLTSAQVPATIFVITETIGRERAFWWDDLDRFLLSTQETPDHLSLLVANKEYRWSTRSLEERQRAHKELSRIVKVSGTADRDSVTDVLSTWSGGHDGWSADCRPLTLSELRRLSDDELITISAHTVHHVPLSSLSPQRQQEEMVESRRELERIVEKPVLAVAYPYGRAQDLTDETVEIARKAGFRAGCTAMPGLVTSKADRFQLCRCEVQDWTIETFAKYMEWLFVSREGR